VRTFVSVGLFSGFNSVPTVPAGSFAKASLVGAKTVNGPAPSRVSTSPAGLYRGHKRGVIGGVHRVLDDVFGGINLVAADRGIVHSGHG
jgi:hypothetical protein